MTRHPYRDEAQDEVIPRGRGTTQESMDGVASGDSYADSPDASPHRPQIKPGIHTSVEGRMGR